MKQCISSLIIVVYTMLSSSFAVERGIVALVNHEPITSYEFQNRKYMIKSLNSIGQVDALTEKQINNIVLNNLIEEQLLLQHADKIGANISDQEIDDAIAGIEKRNNMPIGGLNKFLLGKLIDIGSFRTQIKAELIKMHIMSYILKSIAITPKEIDALITLNNAKDGVVSAQLFTSKNKSPKSLKEIKNLRNRLKNCNDTKRSMYEKFANQTIINANLSTLSNQMQTLAKDLDANQISPVFETTDGFSVLLVCDRKFNNLTSEENSHAIEFLNNTKMSNKAQKFFADLRRKAYIKVLLQ